MGDVIIIEKHLDGNNRLTMHYSKCVNEATIKILRYLGCIVTREGHTVTVDSTNVNRNDVPDNLMREMRSSIVFLGGILGRMGKAVLSTPGGCEIGLRPIDLHLSSMEQFGATVTTENGFLVCSAEEKGLIGTRITLSFPSVGATENILSENGQDIIVLGGPLTQSYLQETTGYKQDITLNFGGNISHKLYFGINFTMQTLWYDKFQKLSEKGENPNDFQTEFEEFTHTYRESTNGIGFNIKAGIIYRPVAGLRLGATISTPTWTRLRNENFETMDARVYQEHYYEESPLNAFQYDITSPLRWGLGVAYTFGNVALISVDYENTNYGSIRFKTDNSMHPADVEYYNKANSAIRTNFKRVNNVRAGMEIKPIQQLSLRFGYNYYDSAEKYFDGDIHYASAGIGFTTKSNIFMDLAYRQQCNWLSEDYELYDTQYIPGLPETLVNSKYMNWKLLFTFGCRF